MVDTRLSGAGRWHAMGSDAFAASVNAESGASKAIDCTPAGCTTAPVGGALNAVVPNTVATPRAAARIADLFFIELHNLLMRVAREARAIVTQASDECAMA